MDQLAAVPKTPLTYEQHLEKMSMRQLEQECRRLTKKPKLDGGIAELLLITIFKTHNQGNDPYILDSNSMEPKTYDCFKSTRAPKGKQ